MRPIADVLHDEGYITREMRDEALEALRTQGRSGDFDQARVTLNAYLRQVAAEALAADPSDALQRRP